MTRLPKVLYGIDQSHLAPLWPQRLCSAQGAGPGGGPATGDGCPGLRASRPSPGLSSLFWRPNSHVLCQAGHMGPKADGWVAGPPGLHGRGTGWCVWCMAGGCGPAEAWCCPPCGRWAGPEPAGSPGHQPLEVVVAVPPLNVVQKPCLAGLNEDTSLSHTPAPRQVSWHTYYPMCCRICCQGLVAAPGASSLPSMSASAPQPFHLGWRQDATPSGGLPRHATSFCSSQPPPSPCSPQSGWGWKVSCLGCWWFWNMKSAKGAIGDFPKVTCPVAVILLAHFLLLLMP